MKENEFEEEDRKKHLKIFAAIKSKNKHNEDYESIFPYTLNVSPEIITVVAEDVLNGWSCKDILSYIGTDYKDKRILWYRQAHKNGLSTSDKNWLMLISALPPVDEELYDVSLNALANKVPFEIVKLFWIIPKYNIYIKINNQLFNMFFRKGFEIAESLYLTYISIKYSEDISKECEILIKKNYDINKIDKIIKKYNK